MSNYQDVIPVANEIVRKYGLCDHCMGRLFSKQLGLSSNKLLGKKLNKNQHLLVKCYICKNLFDNLEFFLKLMLEVSLGYSYSSFSVGAIIKPSIVDRDDHIRSQYKLRGIDSIKTDVTKELGKSFSKKAVKLVDHLDPEITFTLNLKDELCDLRSKPITFSGRYVKTLRGLPQKQKPCDNCSGKGCRVCNFHGISEFDSVEGLISKFLFAKIGGTLAKYTWIGGEDKSSLVSGTGRPFFVKIQNPHKRKLRFSSIDLVSLKISHLNLVRESPKKPVRFNSSFSVKISTDSEIDKENLKNLKNLSNRSVVIYDAFGKRSEKKIFDVVYRRNSKTMFTLTIKAEGGLPIKKFVSDADDVVPTISKILNVGCTCLELDFLDIEI